MYMFEKDTQYGDEFKSSFIVKSIQEKYENEKTSRAEIIIGQYCNVTIYKWNPTNEFQISFHFSKQYMINIDVKFLNEKQLTNSEALNIFFKYLRDN